jgi:hypothetical protein
MAVISYENFETNYINRILIKNIVGNYLTLIFFAKHYFVESKRFPGLINISTYKHL